MVHLQQTREEVFKNTSKLQEKIKKICDRKAKADKFQLDDVVLKWDARNEEKGKHGKFENLWKGPFKIAAYRGQNAFLLKEMNGEDCPGGPINGRLLKRYHYRVINSASNIIVNTIFISFWFQSVKLVFESFQCQV